LCARPKLLLVTARLPHRPANTSLKLAKTRRKAEPLPPVNKALEPFVSALADLIVADLVAHPLRVNPDKR
jgi:hypothetical protein